MARAVVALVGICVARVASAGELVSQGPLAIAAPAGLVLGRDASAAIHVRAEPHLRLVTSLGTISPLVADGGELRGTLTLPSTQSPQIAIVAAIGEDGTVRDWLAIPLAGRARVKVDTEPLAEVVVKVGAAEFGPVRADAHGVANVEIVVPPGITQAMTVATGTSGAVRDKAMPLGVQPFARTLVVCGDLGDRVSVVATLPDGAPAPTAPSLSASTGALTPLAAAGPGVFVATYQTDAMQDAQVTAAFPQEAVAAATCTLQAPPEPPSSIRIAVDRATFIAGSGPVTLAIALAYPGTRRPLAVSSLAIAADVGRVETPHRGAAGWTAAWTLPEELAGKRVARATARVDLPGGAHLTQEVSIELVPTIRIARHAPRFALSVRAGYLSNFGRVTTPVAMASADAALPILDEHLTAGLEVIGYTTSFAVPTMDAGEAISARISSVPVLARLAYRAPVGPIDAWIGAGAGVAIEASRLASPSTGAARETRVPFAASGFAGAATPVGPGWILIEAAYLHATLPASALIAGRIGGLVASAGFLLAL